LRPTSWTPLRAASAIGITATHIGVLKRLAVIELAAAEGVRTYLNPQIVWASADMIRHEEGSISMPGLTEEIDRHARVRMSYPSGFDVIDRLFRFLLPSVDDEPAWAFWDPCPQKKIMRPSAEPMKKASLHTNIDAAAPSAPPIQNEPLMARSVHPR
jgi:hypothetical protein